MPILGKDDALRVYRENEPAGHYAALRAVQAAALVSSSEGVPMDMTTYQQLIDGWMEQAFQGATPVERRKKIRAARFLEEALELFQALDCTEDDAKQLVAYVFGRPKGVPFQEVGGVMVTLTAACSPIGVDLNCAAVSELERIHRPEVMHKIRVKQASKPDPNGPLPGAATRRYDDCEPQHGEPCGRRDCAKCNASGGEGLKR